MADIASGLFTTEAEPRLVGGRHRVSGRIVFPCPEGSDWEAHALPSRGKLWSYTIQRFRPKTPPYAGPDAFAPWAVAYVELGDEVIVEARLADVPFESIRIGMDLELTKVPLDPAAAEPVMIPAYRAVENAA